MPAFHRKRSPPMCDYSLHHVANRPAKIEDKLVATKFHNSITRGLRGGRAAERCGLPAARYRDRIRRECRMRAVVRHRHLAEQEDRAAARAFPASQYGQPRGPSRCAGISRRAGGASHAFVRWPACDSAAIASRGECRMRRGPSSSRSFASPRFRSDRADGYALIAAAIRRATGTAGGLQIDFGYFYPSGRVLDTFSHFPHINAH